MPKAPCTSSEHKEKKNGYLTFNCPGLSVWSVKYIHIAHIGKFRKITALTDHCILIAGMCKSKGTLSQQNIRHDCIHYLKEPYYLHELFYKLRHNLHEC
jgi:hypothetical protein